MDSARAHSGRSGNGAPGNQRTRERDASGIRGLVRRTHTFFARRRVAFGIVFSALVMTDVIVACSVPATYRATAAVAVEPARLPDEVHPLVPTVQGRIATITARATSDDALAHLAKTDPHP